MRRPPVVRLRRLTPAQEQRLELLRRVSNLLDSAMNVPGTSIRFGLDPILGLFPGLGDLVSPLFTIGIIWQARELGVPRVVQLRMIFNVAIDTVIGIVPMLGDIFDVAWKANNRNMALLDHHALEEHPPSRGDWVFVILVITALTLIALLPLALLGWVVSVSSQLFA